VHFLVLAMLLFALEYVFSSTQKDKIIVDQQTADYLIKQREDLELRKLSPTEREETILAFVEDEILYKEAYKRGLDKGDSRMRRNLILKMRGLLIGDLKQPTDDELRVYFETNREKFTQPATLTLDHVFYPDPTQVPQDILAQLRAGADHTTFGEFRLAFGPTLTRYTQRMLVGSLGADAARGMLAIEDKQWQGPLESIHGVHFVRIVDRTPESQSNYAAVKSYLEGDWLMTESRRLIEQEIARLQADYEIVIEADPEAAQ
jgi:hypothetical protein